MKIGKLISNLSKHGKVEVCKEGKVFTVLITGENLHNSRVVNNIHEAIMNYVGDTYPLVEVLKNNSTFYLMVLKPK